MWTTWPPGRVHVCRARRAQPVRSVQAQLCTHTTTDIDECASTPCQNGATCTNLWNKFGCTCTLGYTGTLCDTREICSKLSYFYERSDQLLRIEPVPERGHVRQLRRLLPVQLPGGMDGDELLIKLAALRTNCAFTVIQYCSSTPCQHSGTCTNVLNGYTCACTAGYADTVCATSMLLLPTTGIISIQTSTNARRLRVRTVRHAPTSSTSTTARVWRGGRTRCALRVR